jgi:hypothetical protein
MMIADARYSKSLYEDVFKLFYDWGKRISIHGLPPLNGEPALTPFTVTHSSDMKAAWYLSNQGGSCKTTEFFCTLCSCTEDKLMSYNIDELRCDCCKKLDKHNCYHHAVCDSITVEALLSDLNYELGAYYDNYGKQFDDIKMKSRIKTDHIMANKECDINHIDYLLPMDDDKKKNNMLSSFHGSVLFESFHCKGGTWKIGFFCLGVPL